MFYARRAKALLAAFAVMTVVMGFNNLAKALRHPFATRIAYREFVNNSPTEGWYDVTGGYLDIANAVLPRKEANGYLIPYHAADQPPGKRAEMMVYVEDDPLIRQIDRYNNSVGKDTTLWGMSHDALTGPVSTVTAIPTDISGTVGRFADGSMAGFVLYKDKHPNILLSLGMIVVGFAMCLASLRTFGINLDFGAIKEMSNTKTVQEREMREAVANQSQYTPPPPAYRPFPPQASAPDSGPVQTADAPTPFVPEEPSAHDRRREEEMKKLRDLKTYDPFAE